jgi:hypothetical protein
MKKFTPFILIIFALSNIAKSQPDNKLHGGMTFKTGIRTASVAYTSFTYDTQIYDLGTGAILQEIHKTVSIKDRTIRPNLGVGWEFYYRRFALVSRFDWIIESGPMGGFGLDLGIGYYIGIAGKFTIQPVFSYSWSSTRINVGPLSGDWSYLKIDDTKFYSDEVDVKLVLPERLVKGELNISYFVSDDVALKLYGGYGYKICAVQNYIDYSGEDQDGEPLTATRKISAGHNDQIITSDGIKLLGSFSNQTGLYCGIGLTIFI